MAPGRRSPVTRSVIICVAGFTNGCQPGRCSIRWRQRQRSGPRIARRRAATPTVPTFTPTLVTNTSGAMITMPSNQFADSKFATIIFHGKINTAALTGLQSIVETNQSVGSARVRRAIQLHGRRLYLHFTIAAAGRRSARSARSSRKDAMHTVGISVNFNGTPTIAVEVDGEALANTGDGATGYKINTAFTADAIIDWAVGSGRDDHQHRLCGERLDRRPLHRQQPRAGAEPVPRRGGPDRLECARPATAPRRSACSTVPWRNGTPPMRSTAAMARSDQRGHVHLRG